MRSDPRRRWLIIGYLALLAVAVLAAVGLGWSLWLPLLWSVLPALLVARRLGGRVAFALGILAALAIGLVGLVLTAALSAPIVPTFLVISVLLGAVGSWGVLRLGAGPLPAARDWVPILAPLLGAAVWAATLVVAVLRPGASPLSWVMNGDSANNLLFARLNLVEHGIRLGSGDNPVPLPAGLITLSIASGRGPLPSGAWLEHDITAFVVLWAAVIAVVCVLCGMVAAFWIDSSRRLLRVVVGAAGALLPLGWFVVGYPVEYGFFNAHVSLLVVLACWLAYAGLAARHPASLLGVLAVSCTLVLAVWSPLVLFPGLLMVVIVVRHRTALLRAARWERIVAAAGLAQLLVYLALVTLPSFLAQSSFLAQGGGAFPFPVWYLAGTAVVAFVVLLVSHRILGAANSWGMAAIVVASGLGYGALLFAARLTPQPTISYYPLKFAWLACVILLPVILGAAAGIASRSPRAAPVATIAVTVVALLAVTAPQYVQNSTGYVRENPLVRILAGNFIGDGDATVQRIFRYADPSSPTLLVKSGDPQQSVIDFWVLQMQSNGVENKGTLRRAAYGVLDLGDVTTLCAVLEKIGAPTTILTADAELQGKLAAECAVDVHVLRSPGS